MSTTQNKNCNINNFLSCDNLCGQTLLQIVGNGHIILASLHLLSECIPSALVAAARLSEDSNNAVNKNSARPRGGDGVNNNKRVGDNGLLHNIFGTSTGSNATSTEDNKNDMDEESMKYTPFLFDFAYLSNPHEMELTLDNLNSAMDQNTANSTPTIENSTDNSNDIDIHNLQYEYTINHNSKIKKYYNLFTSIYNYQLELNTFIKNVNDGYYIQYTIESLLLDAHGHGGSRRSSSSRSRILLCESVWLYGVMLIFMEQLFPVRMIVFPSVRGILNLLVVHGLGGTLFSLAFSRGMDGLFFLLCWSSHHLFTLNTSLCSALYTIQGPIRERLIIAYYRFYGREEEDGEDMSNFNNVCKLCKSSGISPPSFFSSSANYYNTASHKYPMVEEHLFSRFSLPNNVIRDIIGTLLSNDIYQHYTSTSFPNSNHRSTRLAKQASMLYVILFFDPVVLLQSESTQHHQQQVLFREIVDKYFYDNWVIHIYAGLTADLSLEWHRFPSAKSALDNVLSMDNVKRMHINNAKLIGQCMAELRAYLTMGILSDSFVLDNRHDLLNCLRRCNIAIRWRVLHRRTGNALYHPIVCASSSATSSTDPIFEGAFAVDDTHVVSLILLTSQLELQLKEVFCDLLDKKECIWTSSRDHACEIMIDISEYYNGNQSKTTTSTVTRHDGLIQWFGSMSTEISVLAYNSEDHFTVTGRKIQLCVEALEEVEQYDLVYGDVPVKAYIQEARKMLLQMARALGINEDICEDINWISDMSYGVESMKSYVEIIHSRISKNPLNVSLLLGFFLKLSSSLDGPVQRSQLKSSDVTRVTKYSSSQLVSFVRNILEIVPVSIFGILVQMSDIERRLQDLPQKMEVNQVVAYAQTGERYKLAMMAQEVAIFADGILGMENTNIGEREVNPRQLLEESLRKELVSHSSELLHNLLQFDFSADSETIASMNKHHAAAMRSLASLSGRLQGFQSALECIDDYACVNGLRMWHEEMKRIISYNLEQEVNKYLLKKVLDSDSKYQSDIIIIPRFPRTQNEYKSINFMGRLVSLLVKITDARYTTCSISESGWYMQDGSEVCGLKTISLLREAIDNYGLIGLDHLLCYRILHELHRFVKFFRTNVSKSAIFLEQLRDELFPEWKTPKNAVRMYQSGSKKTEMLMLPMLTCFRRVGQAQLLRGMIRCELQRRGGLNAKILQDTVSTYNSALMSSNVHQEEPLDGGDPQDVKNICHLTNALGISEPMESIFMKTDPLEGLPVLTLFFVITYVPKLSYDALLGSLSKVKAGYPIDGWPVITGISTLFKHFHPSYTQSFLAYVGQFIRVSAETYATRMGKNEDATRLAGDLKNSIVLMEQFCDISGLSKSAIYEHVPQYIIEISSDLP